MRLLITLGLLLLLAGCATEDISNTEYNSTNITNVNSETVVNETNTDNISENKTFYYDTVYSGDLLNNGGDVKIVRERYT